MNNPDYIEIINDLNYRDVWIPKRIQLELTSDQFIAILKGYYPSWEARYGILYNINDHHFYTYRSGYVVGKYMFYKTANSIFACSDMYDNPEKSDCYKIFDCVKEACRENEVELDLRALTEMQIQTLQMNGLKTS